jgi:hypothetical protein
MYFAQYILGLRFLTGVYDHACSASLKQVGISFVKLDFQISLAPLASSCEGIANKYNNKSRGFGLGFGLQKIVQKKFSGLILLLKGQAILGG